MSIQWHDEFSINNLEIDNQHRVLFELLNNLEKATYSKEFEEVIPETLEKLRSYVEVHFSTEEKYMEKSGYPDRQKHHEIHEALKERVHEEIKLNQTEGYTTLKVMHLYNFLTDWIENHILIEDHKF